MVSQTGQDHVGQMQEHLRSYSLGTQLTNSKAPALGVLMAPRGKGEQTQSPKKREEQTLAAIMIRLSTNAPGGKAVPN